MGHGLIPHYSQGCMHIWACTCIHLVDIEHFSLLPTRIHRHWWLSHKWHIEVCFSDCGAIMAAGLPRSGSGPRVALIRRQFTDDWSDSPSSTPSLSRGNSDLSLSTVSDSQSEASTSAGSSRATSRVQSGVIPPQSLDVQPAHLAAKLEDCRKLKPSLYKFPLPPNLHRMCIDIRPHSWNLEKMHYCSVGYIVVSIQSFTRTLCSMSFLFFSVTFTDLARTSGAVGNREEDSESCTGGQFATTTSSAG